MVLTSGILLKKVPDLAKRLRIVPIFSEGSKVTKKSFFGVPEFESEQEREVFDRLQLGMRRFLTDIAPKPLAPRSVVVVPSLTLDQEVLSKISGVVHYEERMLCLLMLLRLPNTQLLFVSSQPISPYTIDYYLHLLPGVPTSHARERLDLFSCYDSSPKPLTQKILERPRLIERIRGSIRYGESAHLTCFNATSLERTLAVRLSLPLYATDPDLASLGAKSGGRKIFKEAGILLPDGVEDLSGPDDIAPALEEVKKRNKRMKRAVVKLEEGFSGEGNALFSFDGAPENGELLPWIRKTLPERLKFEAPLETWEHYSAKFKDMGGIVEEFVEGKVKTSPSVQLRVHGENSFQMISTHDQVLGGPSGQVFLGCRFPADEEYREQLIVDGLKVGEVLAKKGALGRAGVDFVTVKQDGKWQNYAIEINLRKGGTTHTYLMLQYLVDGRYDSRAGIYYTPAREPRYYFATDNLEDERYQGLLPKDLLDIALKRGLHFHSATQQGVVFHLIGCLSEFGKLGVVSIGDSRKKADELYDSTKEALEMEISKYLPRG